MFEDDTDDGVAIFMGINPRKRDSATVGFSNQSLNDCASLDLGVLLLLVESFVCKSVSLFLRYHGSFDQNRYLTSTCQNLTNSLLLS